MKIDYNIDVICPACSAKAQFTFPFRRIYSEHINAIRNLYPNATFSELSALERTTKGAIVNEYFGSKGIWVDGESVTWLMNMYPQLFSAPDELNKKVGLVKCLQCGVIQKVSLNDELYFYKVAVGTRYLLARKRENLIVLRDWFSMEKRPYVGTTDFPKSFYQDREQIIKGIDSLLAREC
jgi:hypothetical protein